MAEDIKGSQLTEAQREELQVQDIMDAMTGGLLPLGAIAGTVERKVVPKVLEAVEPYAKQAYTAVKEVFGDVRDYYVEKQIAKKAMEQAELQQLRNAMEPLESVIGRGIKEGVMPAQDIGANKGADLFVKNIKELGNFVGNDNLHKYAKLALDDEKNYRETLSSASRFLRALHYDNANPEVGYLIGPSRYGGTWMTHLKGAAAQTDGQLLAVMASNNLRGVAQTIGVSAIGVKTALDLSQDAKEPEAEDLHKVIQKLNGEKALQLALEVRPELTKAAESVLETMRERYTHLTIDEKMKLSGANIMSEADYMDAVTRSIAGDIVTGKFERELDKAHQTEAVLAPVNSDQSHAHQMER
ncbi:MAG: hypothetical protein CVU29_01785 [Betaproteobacteria bacterium HGW-Betaproteobacteria-22]|nr:MAG: hypothetical protein CVU29_01785 [Betaproteobacteria bacterium HGW-Betaproteobacteria-22]